MKHKDKIILSDDKIILQGKIMAQNNGALDTLELTEDFSLNQSGTRDRNKILKRAKSKYFTDSYLVHLLNLDSALKSEYWDTWHCNNVLRYDGSNLYGSYCKKRWCVVCSRILTAKRIKTYLPLIKDIFKDPYFVTLTQPNCTGENLRAQISDITKSFRRILNNTSKNYNYKIKGTRNLEITYNPRSDTYHPHLHCIIDGKEEATHLKNNWLKQFPNAREEAQDIRKFGNHDNDLLEAFKYSQKIITQKDGKKYIYAKPMDQINISTKGGKGGVRMFQTFGFNKIKDVDLTPEEETGIKEIKDDSEFETILYQYNRNIFDWVDHDSGEVLTMFKPSEALKDIRENKIIF